MYKNNPRQTRVNEEVRKEISAIIMNELKDPRIAKMTSIVEVNVTKDLKYCKAFVSILGSEEEQKETLAGLNSSKGFIRKELARRINLRNTPELTFVIDDGIEYSIKMSQLLEKIKTDVDVEEE